MDNRPDAVILCGGAGLRLRMITGDGAKPMAPIADRPFLEILLRQLRRHAFRRIILAVSYRKETIFSQFGNHFLGLNLFYSDEPFPLGTGGALRNAVKFVESDVALVLNGDSYTDADLAQFVAGHCASDADASLLVVKADGRDDCGSVVIDDGGWIREFKEKTRSFESAFVNAGIYVVSRDLLCSIPVDIQISIEHELFPRWLQEKRSLRAVLSSAECVDIGTPERYRRAQSVLATAERTTA
jgi:D-glycero-alpha-D-manno-heptose 1-phosphate guanylyltransferase